MLISFINVYNLDRFLSHLIENGIELEEYAHTVLTDSSEFEVVICRKGGMDIAYMVVHYIDSHYAALSDLGDNASDREILEALLSVERGKLWRVPVEPVLYVTKSYDLLRILNSYADDVPQDGAIYLSKYLSSYNSIKNVVDPHALIVLADRLRDGEPW